MANYFGGTIAFKPECSEQVLSALNLVIARNAKLVVGRSNLEDGMAVLPFGLKEESGSGLRLLEDAGLSINEFKDMMDGCDLKCFALKPSVSNSGHLKLVNELESLQNAMPLSMADISPKKNGGSSGTGSKDDPFSGFVGLDEQIRVFRDLADTVREYGRDALEGLNVVLTGDPGTGKSSVAQAFASYARKEGLVAGPFRQVSAENLIAKYAGQTPSLVRDQWNKARGGVFLLDEAYRLSQDTGGYGREAINTLNELMERDRDTLVICAGYRKEMEAFMEENPGLTHRFSFYVDFPRYDEQTLSLIFEELAQKKGFTIEESIRHELPSAFRRLQDDPHFANGRSARKLLDKCIIKQACYGGGGRTISDEAFHLALAEDCPVTRSKPIGFV